MFLFFMFGIGLLISFSKLLEDYMLITFEFTEGGIREDYPITLNPKNGWIDKSEKEEL